MTNVPTAEERHVFIEKGEAIYNEKYKIEFEEKYFGKVAAIEVESGDAFVGESRMEAYFEGRKKHPGKVFYFIKIGFKGFKKRRG